MNLPFRRAFFVGIKGSGMAPLALLLQRGGWVVEGCDVPEVFTTDTMLSEAGIVVHPGFDQAHLTGSWDVVIYSSAYSLKTPILQRAITQKIDVYSYPDFIAYLSTLSPTYAVIGTHGKTTTMAVTDYLLRPDESYWAIYGSQLINEEIQKSDEYHFGIVEGCEYQDHFLLYHIQGSVLLSVEWDHPDYFPSLEAVYDSFKQFVLRIKEGGFFLYNNDQAGSRLIGEWAKRQRKGVRIRSFGFDGESDYPIVNEGKNFYRVGNQRVEVVVSTPELVLDHIGSLLFAANLTKKEIGSPSFTQVGARLATFGGVRGRLEFMGEEGGVRYYDDYAHHPSEIEVSLAELRSRYPDSKILVIFVPHTASRTHSLLKEFATALSKADYLILQPTFASARGDDEDDPLALYSALQPLVDCTYAEDDEAVLESASARLKEGWLCITMGAGNNRGLHTRFLRSKR